MLRHSIRSDAELGNTMPLEPHRHIKFVTAEIELRLDGTVKSVGIFYTDLALSSLSPGYDANAVEELDREVTMSMKNRMLALRLSEQMDVAVRRAAAETEMGRSTWSRLAGRAASDR
jgi:hypothetical protein